MPCKNCQYQIKVVHKTILICHFLFSNEKWLKLRKGKWIDEVVKMAINEVISYRMTKLSKAISVPKTISGEWQSTTPVGKALILISRWADYWKTIYYMKNLDNRFLPFSKNVWNLCQTWLRVYTCLISLRRNIVTWVSYYDFMACHRLWELSLRVPETTSPERDLGFVTSLRELYRHQVGCFYIRAAPCIRRVQLFC